MAGDLLVLAADRVAVPSCDRIHPATYSPPARLQLESSLKRMLPSLSAAIFVTLISTGVSCTDSADPKQSSMEYKLAVIDRGGYVREDDPLVVRFGRALDRLEAKCPETRQQLGDMGVKGYQIMRDKELREPLVEVFANWRASIPDSAAKGAIGPCADLLAAYVTLRIGQ